MIRHLGSDLPSFKTLSFRPGLNILLADKSEGATDRQSRNGAGKSSLVELIHFLLGAEVRPESLFRSSKLVDHSFDILFDVKDAPISASRSGKRPSRIVVDGNFSGWPITPVEKSSGFTELTNEAWKENLGALWFGLPVESEESHPSFRSLFSYFARRQGSGGFIQPIQHSGQQQTWEQQFSVAYLLGLDWTLPLRFHELHVREKVTKELRKAAKSGELGQYFGRAADLRTRLTVVEARAQRLREQLDSFQVVPQYKELEREANDITHAIDSRNIENVLDGDLVRQLRSSLEDERTPDLKDVTNVYAEVGVIMPDLIKRRFDEVENFHRTILENRRSHLASEISSAETRIVERDRLNLEQDRRRQQIMGTLRSGGALEHYTNLREELGRLEAEVEGVRQRLQTAETIESTKTEMDIERANLLKALRDDIHERAATVREAILTFEQLSESLYERAGSLTIAEAASGPSFDVHIDGQRSKGITNMQIFCFDMTLMEISHKRGRGPGFLVHDSHLFDGVDERQVAKALQLGAEQAQSAGFQYIVTMNSDALPRDGFKGDFNIRDYVMDTVLTDATETGGLFGLRFE
ncbi:ABC-three component system protein [Tunturiibacter lichenicola]|uniref:ABC-three component system protein n=1 Tax=Tunturiibacter lichenicola TaxID=2051959 RepID=UPI0021B44891|nr:ABC-three component system protein [Edaphobacter lichenicola]